jgi:hypothetical protein
MVQRAVMAADILDGHVCLDLECLDRIYLNGYVPNLQVGAQVVQFFASRGFPIPSPAVVGRIGDGFLRSVRSFADANLEDRHRGVSQASWSGVVCAPTDGMESIERRRARIPRGGDFVVSDPISSAFGAHG